MAVPRRGEIWTVDLGMVAKVRPVVILSAAYAANERAVCTYVPRTTAARATRYEVEHKARNFDPGVFDAQGIGTMPSVKFERFLGVIDDDTLGRIESAVADWLLLPRS